MRTLESAATQSSGCAGRCNYFPASLKDGACASAEVALQDVAQGCISAAARRNLQCPGVLDARDCLYLSPCRLRNVLGVLAKAGKWKWSGTSKRMHRLTAFVAYFTREICLKPRHACGVLTAHIDAGPNSDRQDRPGAAKFDNAALNAVIAACTEAARPARERVACSSFALLHNMDF